MSGFITAGRVFASRPLPADIAIEIIMASCLGCVRDAERLIVEITVSYGIMDNKTRAFLMVVRKVLRELLGALEDYMEMPRSIERRIRQ